MSAVSVTITGRDLANLIPQAAQEGLVAAAEVLQSEIVGIFQTNRNGLPSRPGEPPAVQTNTLRQSWELDRGNPAVYSEVEYAGWLETGTTTADNKTRMAARPYVDRSINNATRNGTMVDAFADAAMRRLEAGQ